MKQPMISVVMPVFNGEQFLVEAIESVLTQSFQSFELIVVDDGSSDTSSRIVREFVQQSSKIKLLQQLNSGVTIARNRGVSSSNSPYVAFLDQDDRWTSEALQLQLTYHEKYPEVSYTLGQQVCFVDTDSPLPSWFHLQKVDVPHVGYLPGTLMVKRPLFSTLGMFDPQYPISSDADWFARAKDAQIPMHILPEVILERRIHNENQSQQSTHIHSELFRLLQNSIRRKQRENSESHSG